MSQAPPDTGEQAGHQEQVPPPSPPSPPPDEHETRVGRWALLALGAGLVALLLNGAWALLVVILGVIVMVTLHELGHFLTAKWSGMKVTEFFFGFGPRLWSMRRGETEYGLKALPLGAYVRIIGMNNLDEVAPEDEPRTYRQQSFPKRLLVVLAGPATHFVQAWVLLFVLFAMVGVPGNSVFNDAEPESWSINSVEDDSAAASADLERGDQIVAWNGEAVSDWPALQDAIADTEVGEEVTLTVERDGRRFDATTEIRGRPDSFATSEDPAGSPFLGIGPTFDVPEQHFGVVESLDRATDETAYVTKESVLALGRFLSPSGLSDFADTVSESRPGASTSSSGSGGEAAGEGGSDRPLSIYGAVRIGAAMSDEHGLFALIEFFLIINIFVAILNLVPLPPFDGGHAAVAIYERIRSRRGRRYHADMTKLLPVAYAVVFGVVMLGAVTLYLDIVNPVPT
jgi:membrane-associated protease RseP (regulator of RpoE activity)